MPDDWTLAPEAERDMDDIWDFGAERWSEDQADAYARDLNGLFTLIAQHPHMASTRPGTPEGVRVHPHRAHLIAYRPDAGGILIVRVLHGRSDWRRLLA